MPSHKALRNADAKNRALRSLLQGFVFDVGAAVVLVLLPVFTKANSWSDLQWTLIGFTVFKTFCMAGLSYLMRRVFSKTFPVTRQP